MRKLSLIFAITLFFSIQLSAQFRKGEVYGGFSVGKNLQVYNGYTFQPRFSVGLGKHSTLGLSMDYTSWNSRYSGHSTALGGSINYTYARHFKNSSKWGWYGNASAGVSRVEIYQKDLFAGGGAYRDQFNEYKLSLTPGIFYRVSPRVMLFGSIGGVSWSKYSNGSGPHINFDKQFTVGVNITLGSLGKKQK